MILLPPTVYVIEVMGACLGSFSLPISLVGGCPGGINWTVASVAGRPPRRLGGHFATGHHPSITDF